MAGELDWLAVRHLLGELDWLAVRHLLGELDDAQMARFAELLGEDDAAVAALQRAARLLAALEEAAIERAGWETPSHATPSRATPSHATPSHATPSHATPSHATPSHATPSHATPSHATPSHARPPVGDPRGWPGARRVSGRRGWWLVVGAAGVAAAVAVAAVLSGPAPRPPGRPAELLALWQRYAERYDSGSDERIWDSDERGDADAIDAIDAVDVVGAVDADAADAPPDWLLAAVTLAEVRRQPLDSPDDHRDPGGRN